MSIFSPTSSICRAINIGSKCIQSDGPSTCTCTEHVSVACLLFIFTITANSQHSSSTEYPVRRVLSHFQTQNLMAQLHSFFFCVRGTNTNMPALTRLLQYLWMAIVAEWLHLWLFKQHGCPLFTIFSHGFFPQSSWWYFKLLSHCSIGNKTERHDYPSSSTLIISSSRNTYIDAFNPFKIFLIW